jgi:hypothetical protein
MPLADIPDAGGVRVLVKQPLGGVPMRMSAFGRSGLLGTLENTMQRNITLVIAAAVLTCSIFAAMNPALAQQAKHGPEWNRGCSDAKAGSYDRSRHSAEYETGWQACKAAASKAPAHNSTWNRGCEDAKVGSYDRAHHNADYEAGWQSCKTAAPKAPAHNSTWNRGCADAKAGSYDRAHHNADYEAGWQACKKS